MTGLVSWYNDHEVLIIPHRLDVNMYEIIVSNLQEVHPKIPRNKKKKFFLGGHKIGRVVDKVLSNECELNYVTVYMRKRVENSTGLNEDQYDYIDPSKYIRKKKPKSLWKPICKEAFYHYIGHVADDLDLADEPEDDETATNREVDSKKVKGPKFLHRHHVGKRSVALHGDHSLITRSVNCDESNEKSFKCKLNTFTQKLGEMKENLLQKTYVVSFFQNSIICKKKNLCFYFKSSKPHKIARIKILKMFLGKEQSCQDLTYLTFQYQKYRHSL